MIEDFTKKNQFVQALENLAGSLDDDSNAFSVSSKVSEEYFFSGANTDMILRHVLDQIIDKIARNVVIKTLGGRYVVDWNLSTLRDYTSMCVDFQARVHLWKVKEVPVVYKIATTIDDLPRDVYSCKWCGGYTKNDRRGNCAACGAPRDSSDRSWGIGGE